MSTALKLNFDDPEKFNELVHGDGDTPVLPSGDVLYLASAPDSEVGEAFVLGWTSELPGQDGFVMSQFSLSDSIARSLAGALQGYFRRKDDADPLAAYKELHGGLDAIFAAYILAHPDQVQFLDMPFRQLLEWSAEQAGVSRDH